MASLNLQWNSLTELNIDNVEKLAVVAGVYRLSYRHEDTNIYVFFVGKSTDIKNQLSAHLSKEENNICVKNHVSIKECFFKYAPVEGANIDAVYSQVCNFYQPSCNDKIPASSDTIEINMN